MDKVRVAVVGLGFGGEFVPIYKAWDKTECIAVCRRDEKKLNEFADQFDIPKRYTDYMEMLKDPEIDAVYIASPVGLHARQAKLAADNGKHILLEKPLAMTADEAQEVVDYCKDKGVLVAAGFMMCYGAYVQAMKQAIADKYEGSYFAWK